MTILKVGDTLQTGDKIKRKDSTACLYDAISYANWRAINTPGRTLLGADLMICEYIRP